MTMRYEQIREIPESQDPSITVETRDLVAKVIDNTGLLLEPNPDYQFWAARYGVHKPLPFSRAVGGHGIRTFYHKQERRNVMAPMTPWLNFQGMVMDGLELDPVDERCWAGIPRGWPLRLERSGAGARVHLDLLPKTQFSYTLDVQPAEPDGLDFSVQFVFHKHPPTGRPRFYGAWSCYMSCFDDVRLYYPRGTAEKWQWSSAGEKPDFIPGETVGYVHQQTRFTAEQQALPLAYGRPGPHTFVLMFDDPAVQLFVINAGGHLFYSPIQNPAWDFEWTLCDYPLNQPVGFRGRILYGQFDAPEQILRRYEQWRTTLATRDETACPVLDARDPVRQ